jgi:hypothetical protein
MKWFFLICLALLAIVGNSAIFESFSLLRASGGVAFNVFVLSLFLIWWASYFSGGSTKARSLVIGHALFVLSAGCGLALSGAGAVFAESCESFISATKPNSFRNQFVSYVQSVGYCRELGLGVLLLGLVVAYPSLRLFIGITSRSK